MDGWVLGRVTAHQEGKDLQHGSMPEKPQLSLLTRIHAGGPAVAAAYCAAIKCLVHSYVSPLSDVIRVSYAVYSNKPTHAWHQHAPTSL